jgi:hypothetical protein
VTRRIQVYSYSCPDGHGRPAHAGWFDLDAAERFDGADSATAVLRTAGGQWVQESAAQTGHRYRYISAASAHDWLAAHGHE